jgi:group I intron endonuclease
MYMEIYKITNTLNGKIYIGKDTTSDPKYYGSGLLIRRSIEKYGIDNFTKEIIDITEDYDELSDKEKYWIKQYNSTNPEIGYNISEGGDGGNTLSNHPDLDIIKEKISKNNPKTGKTYEEAFGVEKAKSYKEKLSKNMYNSILSQKAIEKNKKNWEEYWVKYAERCEFLKSEIEIGNIELYIDELNKIKANCRNGFLINVDGFFNYFGHHLKPFLYKNYKSKKEVIVKEKKKVHPIIIDGIVYKSSYDASKKLGLNKPTITHRVKSPYFPTYLYCDDDLNKKNGKYDKMLNKNKQKISIQGVEYESIMEASRKLKTSLHSVIHRLNSKAYSDWFYLDGREKTTDGEKKKTMVSILGETYISIADAVRETGIKREIMRYRLGNEKYQDYKYL